MSDGPQCALRPQWNLLQSAHVSCIAFDNIVEHKLTKHPSWQDIQKDLKVWVLKVLTTYVSEVPLWALAC